MLEENWGSSPLSRSRSRSRSRSPTDGPHSALESQRKALRMTAADTVRTSIVVLLFLVFNRVCKSLFTVFNVYDHDVYGEPVLDGWYSTRAQGAAYGTAFAVGVVGVLLFAIGVPASAMMLLWRNQHRLEDDERFARCACTAPGGMRVDVSPHFSFWVRVAQ